ncbi:MAG TPA: multicopper oxidase domain-containing protein [Gemmatimonadales bacterium]|nr:multicopper oxidase domain-containing protein [Gemmatimonadales bacterium]
MTRLKLLVAAGTLVLLSGARGVPRDADSVVTNDNRTPAGRLHGDTLDLQLEVRMARWSPEADSGPTVEVAAFAEVGKPAQIPGPLIRVHTGTTIVATVANALSDSTIAVHGLVTHPGSWADSLVLHPGESKQVSFSAGVPGTYLYMAVLGKHPFVRQQADEREQVAGAFIVDPPGPVRPDRVFMINIWGSRVNSAEYRPIDYRNAITINGRSWPWTERMEATAGDTLHWRVINASGRTHPMHLHGFYYQVDSRGFGATDTTYATEDRRQVVTEALTPFTTMAMTLAPDRPGNWLFHCHAAFHVIPSSRLNKPGPGSHDAMIHDAMVHMAGLVIGITVHPRAGWTEPSRGAVRTVHLFVQEGKPRNRAPRALGFVLQRGSNAPRPDSVEMPGSVLVLTRGQPTDIVVTNRLREPTAIHWHGIELQSYSDGVAGWSGAGQRLAPSIEPGDSFVAHLTLPRAGTFIYHTHINDLEQLTSGLYGAIVVLEPGQRFDPRRDHVFVAGWDSPGAESPHILINGDSIPAGPLQLQAGVTHRFRFVSIGAALPVVFSIYRDSSLVRWRRVAKDGADLPAHQAVMSPASQSVQVGETWDFEFTPEPGEYRLVSTPASPAKPVSVQRLVVR